jgi:hypothetical protein
MDHPFIDASELTESELHEKLQQLQRLLYSETHFGHKGVTDSIRAAIDVYQQELDERMFLQQHKRAVEKDPDGTVNIGDIYGDVEDYDEEKHTTVEVKRHKDL